jgi:hypothetical protein
LVAVLVTVGTGVRLRLGMPLVSSSFRNLLRSYVYPYGLARSFSLRPLDQLRQSVYSSERMDVHVLGSAEAEQSVVLACFDLTLRFRRLFQEEEKQRVIDNRLITLNGSLWCHFD